MGHFSQIFSKYLFSYKIMILLVSFFVMNQEEIYGITNFGTGCTGSYENNWAEARPFAASRCQYFYNQMKLSWPGTYFRGLVDAKSWWEEPSDDIDLVDMFFGGTHGGAFTNPIRSVWAMWNGDSPGYGIMAESNSMRLGDDSHGTRIFSTYSCETLKISDNLVWTRMGYLFKGGLIIATGSHGSLYDSLLTVYDGSDYANYLRAGHTVKSSWHDALAGGLEPADVAVMATGTTSADCASRRDSIKATNSENYSVLRDTNIKYWCASYWTDLY